MRIISIHNGHDACITAIEDGEIIYHWELERNIYKVKHFAGFHNKNIVAEFLRCHVLPLLLWDNVDYISLGSLYAGWLGDCYKNSEFFSIIKDKYGESLSTPYVAWEAHWNKKSSQKFFANTHHVSHMAYSYYTSPFDEALLFAYDGEGDFNTTTTYGIGRSNKLEYTGNLATHPREDMPNTRIGYCYNRLCNIVPFFGKDLMATPGKAMGYSSYGKARDEWKPAIVESLVKAEMEPILQKLDLPNDLDSKDQRAMDLVATLQTVAEDYVINCLRTLMKETGIKNICLSGGCALNVLINERIREEVTENLYVPPACSDTGQSLGSGLYLWHHILDKPFKPKEWHNPYLGDYIQDNRIQRSSIERKKLKDEDDLIEEASNLLIEGKIIGWAHGRSEIGPRALGNRSILCFPAKPNMKDLINEKVKHREWWRPFAPICLYEDFPEWFETTQECPYMLRSPLVKENKRDIIPAVTHVDGTARLQTVRSSQNPLLHKLLEAVKEKTGVPILLNTSLNGQAKPIINNVEAICDLLETTELDCAFVGTEMLRKRKLFL